MRKIGRLVIFLASSTGGVFLALPLNQQQASPPPAPVAAAPTAPPTQPAPLQAIEKIRINHSGEFKLLPANKHIFQTFNNCGPATLSMLLSYQGIEISQQELGRQLRPYQNPNGDNDDKSVTLEEFADFSKQFGLTPFLRPNGSVALLKLFLANDIPVVVRTWLHPGEDIGHFRIVRGFDDATQSIIQDDSYEGPNLYFSYDKFLSLWQPFNYEYLVLVPKEKEPIVLEILGEEQNEQTAWEHAMVRAKQELQANPQDIYSLFNLSVAHFHLGNYQQAVNIFEQVQPRLPKRMLWYQIEPIVSYQKLGDNARVFSLTDAILNSGNRAFTELYLIRAEVYRQQGNIAAAKGEVEKAIFYNQNSQDARKALKL